MAPVMAAFSAGTALGPAIGGMAADMIGVQPTFGMVVLSFASLAFFNQLVLSETQSGPYRREIGEDDFETTKKNMTIKMAFDDARNSWVPLMQDPRIRNVVFLNSVYWVALAGSQMTLLPLYLTNPAGFALTAGALGKVYAGMSAVQVIATKPIATLADSFGKRESMIGGCMLVSGSMFGLTQVDTIETLAAVLGMWSLGSTFLSVAPFAYVADVADSENRAQAMALLRTFGDVGFLVGAGCMGAFSDLTSMDTAIITGGGLLLSATSYFSFLKMRGALGKN